MSLEKILIVEDEPIVRSLLQNIFLRHKCSVSCAATIAEANDAVTRESFDLMMLDIRLPDGDGQRFLDQVVLLPERPLVVMVTGYGTIDSAVSCMRAGAFDYVLKPFAPSQIDVIMRKAQSYRQLLSINRLLSDDPEAEDFGSLVGRGAAMTRLRQLVERVAPTDATALITGESGTGKELIARELYRRSARRGQPFIKVNCAAISENLIESEFFGHERGAFTGATARREGRFELANQGTLLLDEVSEIPSGLQAKLLRVLQEREFERVGGSRTIKVNVRIIATSNRDLASCVEKGAFRQDLFYRLNVFPLRVPTLRERTDDLMLLANHFLLRFARKHGIKLAGLSDSAEAAIMAYGWPGNVRELQNTIERAVILSEPGRLVTAAVLGLPGNLSLAAPAALSPAVAPQALPAPAPELTERGSAEASSLAWAEAAAVAVAPTASAGDGGVVRLDEMEKQAILAALRQTGGNRTQAAIALGISIRTLRNKLQEYREAGVPVPETGED
jgi:DNA-binding NtrC family response regulator